MDLSLMKIGEILLTSRKKEFYLRKVQKFIKRKRYFGLTQKSQGLHLDIEKEVFKVTAKKEEKKKRQIKPTVSSVWRPRYIHEVFTQERLLKDAVAQEFLNKYSLVRVL